MFYRNLKTAILMLTVLLYTGCEPAELVNTDKDTYGDDIADIAFLNGAFFTTNYDLSGHAGSQIDLLKFVLGDSGPYLADSYDLDMNGQGYLAICTDGTDLYLQSRSTDLVIKCSAIGEKAYLRYDVLAANWQPSGVSYDSKTDSLLLLYRNLQNLTQYRLRLMDKQLLGPASRDQTFSLDFIDQGLSGIYSLTTHDSSYYLLGVDTTQTDILIIGDQHLSQFQPMIISDSTVVGLSFVEDDLYFSYRDRRIEYWSSF